MAAYSTLVFNAGSSSLKFALFEAQVVEPHKTIIKGTVSDIGGLSSLNWSDGTTNAHIAIKTINHESAAELVLDWLNEWPLGSLLDGVGVVAHRVVHGGKFFYAPTIVTEKIMLQLEALTPLAPLHNPLALSVMRVCKKKLSTKILTVAVFDTAFYHDLPQHTGYALPESLLKQYDIRRYGFHGLAHRNMVQQYCKLHHEHTVNHRIISFQLGHGCSVTATLNGKPVDTSMGFTPLEGLMMATRAGDIDPGILIYLLQNGHPLDELEQKLNYHSGLLGVAKVSADMRELLSRQDSDTNAKLAIDMFCHRARKYLGAYLAVLHGAEVIIFGGGIGEHAAEIRQRICENMQWCGLQLDETRNQSAKVGAQTLISSDDSKIHIYVIPVNEESLIAEDAIKSIPPSF
jgi:acetate kinase